MKGDKIQYRAGYKYSLWNDYSVNINIFGRPVSHRLFTLDSAGKLTIFADYPWDGPSGPTFDSKTGMRASLVHDALFEMLRLGLLPHDPCFHIANLEFRKILLEDQMCELRAKLWFRGVESFGDACAAACPVRIISAP